MKKNTAEALRDHLNQVDLTFSIKFMFEEEQEEAIPFLDTLTVRKPDKSIKLVVYREKTHTDQHLSFSSHQPLTEKMGIVRTLFDRNRRIVSEQEDQMKEEEHIRQALARCGYPKWTIDKVKKRVKNNNNNNNNNKNNNNNNSSRKSPKREHQGRGTRKAKAMLLSHMYRYCQKGIPGS